MPEDTSINEMVLEEKPKWNWFKKYYVWLLVPLLFVVVVIATEVFLIFSEVPTYIFPQPSLIAKGFAEEWQRTLLPHLWITLREVLIGYAIGATLGIIMGAIVDQSKIVEAIITPYVLILVTTPMVSLVPLLMLKFGFGKLYRLLVNRRQSRLSYGQ